MKYYIDFESKLLALKLYKYDLIGKYHVVISLKYSKKYEAVFRIGIGLTFFNILINLKVER